MPVHGLGPYDTTNVFARILRGELPCRRVYEDEYALAFHDIVPQAPVHVLVIPKVPYVSLADFATQAAPDTVGGFFSAVAAVARQLGLEAPGYRIVANVGQHAHQEVPHFHVHILGGQPLGARITTA